MQLARRIAAAILGLCGSGAAWADIYSFVDEHGVAHFSNVPAEQGYELVFESPIAADNNSHEGHKVPVNATLLARARRYEHLIREASILTAVDAQLLNAVILVESAFDESALSSQGAQGLMQLMPETALHYGVENAFSPGENIRGGARYLRDLIDRYGNNLELVLAAYNAGEAAVERYGRTVPPFQETRAYVPRVMSAYSSLRQLAEGN